MARKRVVEVDPRAGKGPLLAVGAPPSKPTDDPLKAGAAVVVGCWQDSQNVYISVRVGKDTVVDISGATSDVEYVASTSILDSQGRTKSPTILKQELLANVKQVRSNSKALENPPITVNTQNIANSGDVISI